MDELTVTHQAEVLALKFALAFVVEVLPDDGRTSIRESLARLGAGADHSNHSRLPSQPFRPQSMTSRTPCKILPSDCMSWYRQQQSRRHQICKESPASHGPWQCGTIWFR